MMKLIGIIIVCLVMAQAFAYYSWQDLSLGPRVILQPWLMQKGLMIYEDFADIHSPLLPLLLSVLRQWFPDGVALAKNIMIVFLSITTVLVFLVGRRTSNPIGGLLAVLFFVALSPMFLFTKLWYESLIAPIYLAWILLYKPDSENQSLKVLLYCGLLGGIALLIKQHAIMPFAGIIVWHACSDFYQHRSVRKTIQEIGIMAGAAALPLAAFCLYYYLNAGTVKGLVYWTFLYALTGSYLKLASALPKINEIKYVLWGSIFLPFAFYAMINVRHRKKPEWLTYGLGFVLLATSSLFVLPRFTILHLQATLPLVAVLSSMTIMFMVALLRKKRLLFVLMILTLTSYWLISVCYTYGSSIGKKTPQFIYEYSDLIPLAKGVRSTIGDTDCVFIFPDDEAYSNLYYIMQCPPPYFWIFHYPWYLNSDRRHQIQKMLMEVPPKWIVHFPDHWGGESYAPEIAYYIKTHYQHKATFPWRRGTVNVMERISLVNSER
ncbi:MAG: hypothetical protein A2Y62_04840 [Candidatus Fischerbacteria bacterium RBG_13_37_8]|uniref:Uncharacterized protein n=1 Tax=Candidatus Fischerbacteria bacterium RBG_13_37_8 TaxID=1817863 RepID=A0A1F5VHM1_9BACT|nr:MAG: hypothetical protein A2Y62_04840 [Candidatus Fischerbacteria bacterium RBG_13_37_8]